MPEEEKKEEQVRYENEPVPEMADPAHDRDPLGVIEEELNEQVVQREQIIGRAQRVVNDIDRPELGLLDQARQGNQERQNDERMDESVEIERLMATA